MELRTSVPKAPRIGSLSLQPLSGPAAAAFSSIDIKRADDNNDRQNKDTIPPTRTSTAPLPGFTDPSLSHPSSPARVSLSDALGDNGVAYTGIEPFTDIGPQFPGVWRVMIGALIQSGPTLGPHESLFQQALSNIDWCLASLVVSQPQLYRALSPSIQQ
jgi:hypothetical protein